MKNLILLLTVSLLASTGKTVYICNGPKSIAYHSTRNCNGLNNCSTTIREITISEANKIGRRACRICKPSTAKIDANKIIHLINPNTYAYKLH